MNFEKRKIFTNFDLKTKISKNWHYKTNILTLKLKIWTLKPKFDIFWQIWLKPYVWTNWHYKSKNLNIKNQNLISLNFKTKFWLEKKPQFLPISTKILTKMDFFDPNDKWLNCWLVIRLITMHLWAINLLKRQLLIDFYFQDGKQHGQQHVGTDDKCTASSVYFETFLFDCPIHHTIFDFADRFLGFYWTWPTLSSVLHLHSPSKVNHQSLSTKNIWKNASN